MQTSYVRYVADNFGGSHLSSFWVSLEVLISSEMTATRNMSVIVSDDRAVSHEFHSCTKCSVNFAAPCAA